MPRAPLVLILFLAACGASPREECLAQARAELETIDTLIDETEANVLRGYALAPDESQSGGFRVCAGGTTGPLSLCAERDGATATRPVAIDPAAERQKLDNLRQRRMGLAILAEREAARCEALYSR